MLNSFSKELHREIFVLYQVSIKKLSDKCLEMCGKTCQPKKKKMHASVLERMDLILKGKCSRTNIDLAKFITVYSHVFILIYRNISLNAFSATN